MDDVRTVAPSRLLHARIADLLFGVGGAFVTYECDTALVDSTLSQEEVFQGNLPESCPPQTLSQASPEQVVAVVLPVAPSQQ